MSLLQRLSLDLDISTRQVERRLEHQAPPGFLRAGRRGHWRAKGPITPARIGRIRRLWGMGDRPARERRLRRIECFVRRLEANLFADIALLNGYRFADAKTNARKLIAVMASLPAPEQLQEAVRAVQIYLRNRKRYAVPADERIEASLVSFGAANEAPQKHLPADAPEMLAAQKNRDRVRLECAAIELVRLGVGKITRAKLAEQMRMPERTFYFSFTARQVDGAIARAEGQQLESKKTPVDELFDALVALENAGADAPDSEASLAKYFGMGADQFSKRFGSYVEEARREFDAALWNERTFVDDAAEAVLQDAVGVRFSERKGRRLT
jgi:hypothetical protein